LNTKDVLFCAQVLKGSHSFPLMEKRREGKGVTQDSDRTGAEDENVLGAYVRAGASEGETTPCLKRLPGVSFVPSLSWQTKYRSTVFHGFE
jgi:hypothetical protein